MIIVYCTDHLQDIGEVVAVGESLVVVFGMYAGDVVAHNTIQQADGSNLYLIERAPPDVKLGQLVRVRLGVSA